MGHVGTQFLLQMGVGAAVGILGGLALGWHMRHVSLPSEGLYPLRTLAGVLVLFGVASVAHGSGFLAVGLIVGAALAIAIRPVLVGLCLLPARLKRNEQTFVLLSGLKGAVPILLATYIRAAHPAHAQRLFEIVVVVVLFSVVVQGSLVPMLAERLRLPIRVLEPEPWAFGVRLRDEPDNAHRLTIMSGAAADGLPIGELGQLTDQRRVSLLVRDATLVPITPDTRVRGEDTILVLTEDGCDLEQILEATS